MKWTENSVFSLQGAAGLGDILQFSRLPEYFYRDFGKPFRLLSGDRFGFFYSIKHVEIIDSATKSDIVRHCWQDSSSLRDNGSPPYKAVWQYTDVSDKNLKPIIDNKHAHPRYAKQIENIRKKNKPVIALVLQGTSAQFKFSNGHVPGLTWEIPNEITQMLIRELSKTHRFILIGLKDYETEIQAEDFRMDASRSIFETFDILQLCSYYVGVNTGLMHLAACIPHLKICMYTQTPIKYPVWENDTKKFHAFDWLYNDSIYWGHRRMEDNVLSPIELIDYIQYGK